MASFSSRLYKQITDVITEQQILRKCLSTTSCSRRNKVLNLSENGHSFQSRNKCLRSCHTICQRLYTADVYKNADGKTLPKSPYQIVKPEVDMICHNINETFRTKQEELREMAQYYFDGQGKAFRPMVVLLMAKALNMHQGSSDQILQSQQQIAMISEMIHTASLIHDDVIDISSTRRGKSTVDNIWGQRKAILVGDYILSVSSMLLAQLRNEEVVKILSQVIEDLVRGEFMQLGSKEDYNERFNHYLKKTFKKTASLIAHSCKAVAVLSNCDNKTIDLAYNYGKNIGISFQLIDDLLDYTSHDDIMGKPTAADLKLGLATAPVLFAAQEYGELNALIMRRFSQDGDVELARELVAKSNGVSQTRQLAEDHSEVAVELISELKHSEARDALEQVANIVLNRKK